MVTCTWQEIQGIHMVYVGSTCLLLTQSKLALIHLLHLPQNQLNVICFHGVVKVKHAVVLQMFLGFA